MSHPTRLARERAQRAVGVEHRWLIPGCAPLAGVRTIQSLDRVVWAAVPCRLLFPSRRALVTQQCRPGHRSHAAAANDTVCCWPSAIVTGNSSLHRCAFVVGITAPSSVSWVAVCTSDPPSEFKALSPTWRQGQLSRRIDHQSGEHQEQDRDKEHP